MYGVRNGDTAFPPIPELSAGDLPPIGDISAGDGVEEVCEKVSSSRLAEVASV